MIRPTRPTRITSAIGTVTLNQPSDAKFSSVTMSGLINLARLELDWNVTDQLVGVLLGRATSIAGNKLTGSFEWVDWLRRSKETAPRCTLPDTEFALLFRDGLPHGFRVYNKFGDMELREIEP